MGVELEHRYGQIPEMEEEVNYSDSEIVYYVRDALIAVKSGNGSNYNELVGSINYSKHHGPEEAALLSVSLQALSAVVSYIDDTYHDTLLNSVFRMSVWKYGPDVMDSLITLLKSLATSNGKYVDQCLDMLVSNFMPPEHMIAMLRQVHGQEKKKQVLSRVHKALEDIVNLVPMAALRLPSIIVHTMHKTFRKEKIGKDHWKYNNEMCVKNMLRLNSGAIREFVGGSMLMAVVDVLRELDVMIGWNDILREDSSKGIFVMELEDVDEAASDDEEDYDGEEIDLRHLFPGRINECIRQLEFSSGDSLISLSGRSIIEGFSVYLLLLPLTLSQKNLGKNVVAELLDGLMVQVFEHLESCANEHRLAEVFETLMDSFMITILNTYKSKFAQFVVFYACALDPEHCGVKFSKVLADRFISGDNPLTRMSAVAYLASYLARAKFLSAALVTGILNRLVDWCLEYCTTHGDMDPKGHRVFYSCCQAIMYILCFHMRSIMDIPVLKSQLFLMPFEAIFKHKLEPLKVCLPSIVDEFLKQAKAAHLFPLSETEIFMFEDTLESDLSRDFGGIQRLDMFFPFDPCLLKRCDRNFIRPNFVYWRYVRTTYSIDEEDSSDEDEEGFEVLNGEDLMEDGMARSFDQLDVDLAMNRMSITPKNGLQYIFGAGQMHMPSKIRPSTSPQSL